MNMILQAAGVHFDPPPRLRLPEWQSGVSFSPSADSSHCPGAIRTLVAMPGILIGYARCSTDKHDLTAQRNALRELGVDDKRIYLDHCLTGRNERGRKSRVGAIRNPRAIINIRSSRVGGRVTTRCQGGIGLAGCHADQVVIPVGGGGTSCSAMALRGAQPAGGQAPRSKMQLTSPRGRAALGARVPAKPAWNSCSPAA